MAHVIDFKEAGFDSVLDELEWRGLISQSTDRDRLAEALNGEPVSYYCGFDPTAASLHIGNLVQLINMRHLQAAGHHPIALVGGATGLIGDPRQSGERTLNPKDVVAGWADRLKKQIGGILETDGDNPVRFVSNYDWTASMTVIDFLRDVGKNFRLGTDARQGHRSPSTELRGRHLLHRIQLSGAAGQRLPAPVRRISLRTGDRWFRPVG